MKYKPIFRIFGIFYEQCNPVLGSKMSFCSQNFRPTYHISAVHLKSEARARLHLTPCLNYFNVKERANPPSAEKSGKRR